MSRKVWLVSSRLAVRKGRRLASRSCSATSAIHTEGSARTSVRFSTASRKGPGPHFGGLGRAPAPCCRSSESVCRSLVGSPFTSMKCAAWVTGSNTMRKRSGICSDICAFSPAGSFERIERDLLHHVLEAFLGQVDAGAPEDLPEILPHGQRMRIVRGDAAHARIDREGDLDHLVERRLIAGGAERAVVGLLAHGLERVHGVEHAAAAGAQHVPGQFEQAEPRGMQEAADRLFLVEPALGGEVQHVDAAQLPVGAVGDQRFDRGDDLRVGRIAQGAEQGRRVVHGKPAFKGGCGRQRIAARVPNRLLR